MPLQGEKGGLRCPICDSAENSVSEVRTGTGYIWRRRKCSNGHTFITTETVVRAARSYRKAALAAPEKEN